MTVYEMAKKYYPKMWDKARLAALVKAGKLTEAEYMAALSDMASAALVDGCTASNPRTPGKEDVMEIYKKIW